MSCNWDVCALARSVECVPGIGVYSCDANSSNIFAALRSSDLHILDTQLNRICVVPDCHQGKTPKCVRSRGDALFASVGNDRSLRIGDVRCALDAVAVVPELHRLAINHVAWNPVDDCKLLTSSFDGNIHVVDVRLPQRPCCSVRANNKVNAPA